MTRLLVPLAAVALLVSACSGSGDEEVTPESAGLIAEQPPSGTDATATPGPGSADGATADGTGQSPETTPRSDGTASDDVVPGDESATSGRRLPAAGLYRYTDRRSGDDAQSVTIAGNRTTVFHDIEHDGERTRREVVLADGALRITREQRTDGDNVGRECPWSTPLTWVPSDLTPGATWDTTGSCATETDFGTIERARQISGEVKAETSTDLDGQSHPAITLFRKTVTKTTGPGVDLTETLVETVTWIPSLGLEAAVESEQLVTEAGIDRGVAVFAVDLVSTTPS